ncbi:hypothetical protein NKH18_15255 [Streptomyces sp. M10(2022)]
MSAGSSGGPHLAHFDTRNGTGTVVGITTASEELAGGPTPRSTPHASVTAPTASTTGRSRVRNPR